MATKRQGIRKDDWKFAIHLTWAALKIKRTIGLVLRLVSRKIRYRHFQTHRRNWILRAVHKEKFKCLIV